jgi:hypothetical protein
MFDADYGPYRGDPRDPRYDDSEDLAREEWESENTYAERIGEDAVEEILFALENKCQTFTVSTNRINNRRKK